MEASITLEQNSISNDEKKFINFLNERRIKNGKASHTGVGKQTGKFLIEGPQLKIFYQLYAKRLLRWRVQIYIRNFNQQENTPEKSKNFFEKKKTSEY